MSVGKLAYGRRHLAGEEFDRVNVAFIALIVFFALAAVFFVIMYSVQEQQRREQLSRIALRIGMDYSADADQELWDRLAGFGLFSKGFRRKAYNVLHRQIRGIDVTLLDYQYTTRRSKRHRTSFYTVALFETDRLKLPRFTLHPQYFYHQIADALGLGDIDFEEFPEFSESYRLKGDDEARIRRTFDSGALHYFTRHPGLHAEGYGQRLIHYRDKHRVDPKEMESFMQQGLDILDVFMEKEGALGDLALIGLDIEDARDDQLAMGGLQ
jgi:hypothetical protein